MTQNTQEVIALLAKIDRALEDAVRLRLTTTVYLLRMVRLDIGGITHPDFKEDCSFRRAICRG